MVKQLAITISSNISLNRSMKRLLFLFLIIKLNFYCLEIDLKLDQQYQMQIYKKSNFEDENSYYKNSMFDFNNNDLCQNSLTTSCPFNKFYYENYTNNKTNLSFNFIVIPEFEKLEKVKNNYTIIENQSLNNKNEEYSKIDYFRIDKISNNLETIKAGYNISLSSNREYVFKFEEKSDLLYFEGFLEKKGYAQFYIFNNYTEINDIYYIKGFKGKDLNTQTDYENFIFFLRNKIQDIDKLEDKKNLIKYQIFYEKNISSIFPVENSQFSYKSIKEYTYNLIIYHYCFCDKKSDFFSYLKSNEPQISNKSLDHFTEIKNKKDVSELSTKWSNFEIEFSYKYFNNESKNFEYKSEKLSFLKVCTTESIFLTFVLAAILIALASLITFYSTNNKVTNPIIKEMKKEVVEEIKWWHGIYFLLISSLFLIIIFYFMKYIGIIYTILVAFYSLVCSFWTLNYIFKTKFIKGEDNSEGKTLIPLSENSHHQNLSPNTQNKEAYDNLEINENNKKKSCKCEGKDISMIANPNESYKVIDKKSENQFDPEFLIKDNKYDNKYYQKNKNDFFDGEIGNKNDNFLENDNDIELQGGNIKEKCDTNSDCENCCKNNSKIKDRNDGSNGELKNFTMNPIYNYRNNKFLVILNKKILNFETTKNTDSHFYCEVKLRLYELINLLFVLTMIIYWSENRNWMLNNFFAFSLCFVMLSFLTIRNFKICMVILACIFFYDVFWVFFSKQIFKKNVMVEVAISLNIPIKLELPPFFLSNPSKNCMILGLGDIILPGIIIKYCKNFDYLKIHNNIISHLNYYKLSLKLYVVSLILAFMANLIFSHAQPVLFYIAPIFIVGLLCNSIRNGEMKDFLNGENHKITQMCVDEIINTEFSKFEEGEIHQKDEKGNNKNKTNTYLSTKDVTKNNITTNTNNRFSTRPNKNFIVLDEI